MIAALRRYLPAQPAALVTGMFNVSTPELDDAPRARSQEAIQLLRSRSGDR